MNELLKSLEQHKQGKKLNREEFVENAVKHHLIELIDEKVKKDFEKIESIFIQLGFVTEPISFGFKTKLNNQWFQLGIGTWLFGDSYRTSEREDTDLRLGLKIYHWFHYDFLSKDMDGYINPDIYEKDGTEKQEEIAGFLMEHQIEINQKLKNCVKSGFSYLPKMILDEKRSIGLVTYIELKSLFEQTNDMPIVSLRIKHLLENSSFYLLEETIEKANEEEKLKLLIGMIPALNQKWAEYHSLLRFFNHKKDIQSLDGFLLKHYPKDVIEHVIKTKKKNKLMLRAYGYFWKNIFKENFLYQQIEEFLSVIKETENNLDFKLYDKDNLFTVSLYDEKSFNPSLLNFSIGERNDKLSIHFMSWINGYDLKTKDANFVEVGMDIKIFDYTNKFAKDEQYSTDFQTLPSVKSIQEWMEKTNKTLKTFLN